METGAAGFYASKEGGRVAYSAATDTVKLTGPGPHVLAALEVPAGTDSDLYPTLGEFANLGASAVWRRYGGSKLTQRGTPQAIRNRGGGERQSQTGFYVAGNFTATLSTTPGKQALIAAGAPYIVPIDNVLRPGTCIVWTVEAYAIGAKDPWLAAMYLEFHELPAQP